MALSAGQDPTQRGKLTVPRTHWRVLFATPGASTQVWVKCTKCGGVGQLDHSVGTTGKVTPSLDCPNADCDFHEHVRLEGWPGGGTLSLG